MEQLPLFPEHETPVLDGVKILLDRMEKFPEEFSVSGSRWGWLETFLTPSSLNPLTQSERDALMNALRKAHREAFTATVLRVLSNKDYEGQSAMYTHSGDSKSVYAWSPATGMPAKQRMKK